MKVSNSDLEIFMLEICWNGGKISHNRHVAQGESARVTSERSRVQIAPCLFLNCFVDKKFLKLIMDL